MFSSFKSLIMCVLMGLLLASCSGEEQAKVDPIRPINWIKVKSGNLDQVRRFSGVVEAEEQAELSFQVGGKISTVNAKLGDRVKKGDVLAVLESSSYNLNTLSANADLSRARSELTQAKNEFERKSKLLAEGWVTESGYDDAKAVYEAAKNNLDAAQARYELRQKDLKDTQLKAPYDGVITARRVEPSQQVTAGQTSFEIEGKKGLKISVLVPGNLLEYIDQDKLYTASFPTIEGGLSTQVDVHEISTQAEAANAFRVTLHIGSKNPAIRVGMSAEVDFAFTGTGIITGHKGEVVYVPPTALLAGDGDKTYAFVYNPKNKAVERRTVLAENIINNTVLVTKGLKADEIIATSGVEFLHDGQKVKLLGDGPKVFN